MEKAIIGLAGVVLGAVLTTFKDLWISHIGRKKKAEYLAILVSCICDRFVDGCVLIVGDVGTFHGQTNEEGYHEIQVPYPDFNIHNLEVDWQSLPSELMYEILSFPNLIEESKHRIDGAFTYEAGPPDYAEGFEERQLQYAILGIKAGILADKLRKKYCLPLRKYDTWNPIEFMKKDQERILKRRDKRENRLIVE